MAVRYLCHITLHVSCLSLTATLSPDGNILTPLQIKQPPLHIHTEPQQNGHYLGGREHLVECCSNQNNRASCEQASMVAER